MFLRVSGDASGRIIQMAIIRLGHRSLKGGKLSDSSASFLLQFYALCLFASEGVSELIFDLGDDLRSFQ